MVMKKMGWIVLVFVLLVGATVLWLRSNLDGLVQEAIAAQGSAMVRARVGVGRVELHPQDGKGVIRDLSVDNPAGFQTPYALKVGTIALDLDVASLTQDVVLIRSLVIEAPDIIYEQGAGTTNLDAIQRNIAMYLDTPQKKSSSNAGKRLIVQELTVRNARAQASGALMQGKTVQVSLPDITLRDLGKSKGGIPPGELGREVTQALKQKLAAGVSFDSLTKSAGQAVDKAGDALKNLFRK
ncbi:MAG: hypothetical protein HYX43_00205 [Burkholderiales bacterium]|nr:hypothetical protein [Burkholderiales bacterium]